jgi:hypothetical protein
MSKNWIPEEEYQRTLDKIDWALPGMELFPAAFMRLIIRMVKEGDLVHEMCCLGWAYWPTKNRGYLDSGVLRHIADFIDIQNKPFWADYERYCDAEREREAINGNQESASFEPTGIDCFNLPPGTTAGLV